MTVAVRTPSTIGVSNWICLLLMTLSTKYFVEAGRTNPATRLIAISTKPSASSPRLGFINAHTSGRLFHALRFTLLAGDWDAVPLAMTRRRTIPYSLDARRVLITILGKQAGRSRYLQSPAAPAGGTLALAGRSRLKTLEMNSLIVIPRCPQSLRFRLV